MNVRRFASVIRLRPDRVDQYRRLHREVWPEVLQTLSSVGIRNYSIFFRDGLLFSYYEYVGDDHAADMARMAADPATQRWWSLTDPCQEPVQTAEAGEWWAPAVELFHLE